MTFYIGCAVWAHDDWVGSFYPPATPSGERLAAYARRLTAVELNSSFYAVPPIPTVRKWAADTPETFRFSPKFPKSITHTSQLKNVDAQARTFIGTMKVLGPRLGPLMLQLPPSFGPSRIPTLAAFLENLPEGTPVAVEVRHPDFFTTEGEAELTDVLGAYKVGRVLFDSRPAHDSDSPEADDAKERKPNVPLVTDPIHPGFVLVRYISSPVQTENEPFWAEWTAQLAAWVDEGRDIYFYVHCPVELHSPGFARAIYDRVRAVRPSLPPLPWDDIDRQVSVPLRQLPLF